MKRKAALCEHRRFHDFTASAVLALIFRYNLCSFSIRPLNKPLDLHRGGGNEERVNAKHIFDRCLRFYRPQSCSPWAYRCFENTGILMGNHTPWPCPMWSQHPVCSASGAMLKAAQGSGRVTQCKHRDLISRRVHYHHRIVGHGYCQWGLHLMPIKPSLLL